MVTRLPQNKLSIKEVLQVIEDFTSFISILYPTPLSFQIFKKLLEDYTPTGLVIHDYEIMSIAIENNINTIATFNSKDFSNIKELNTLVF